MSSGHKIFNYMEPQFSPLWNGGEIGAFHSTTRMIKQGMHGK